MVARCVESFKYISDRVMSIRIRGKPLNATIIQLYAPTADAPEQDVEQCYALARKARDQAAKKDMVFVMGDLDAKAGEGEDVGVIIHFALANVRRVGLTTQPVRCCGCHMGEYHRITPEFSVFCQSSCSVES